jgi:phosphatidylserine/phosphatidylglycerophosphate/cardiolipin synthase-like enzyme
MDLAGGRWDTPEHRAKDPRRANAEESYPPSHDVQAMVDGKAAAALAEIVRERWYRATGASMPKTEAASDPWPDGVAADLTNVDIAISRTGPLSTEGDLTVHSGHGGSPFRPGRQGRPALCREVESLHLDLIAAARESLYIENQYLTSPRMVDALSRRLQEADGPEIVIVIPLNNAGWLEDHTIEVLRFRQVRRLRTADRFRRLRICYPTVRGLQDESIVVHSKILVVDNRLFRVGSSNLTERSMRLDTECDLTLEAADERQQAGIARLRNRLLGEHLGLSAETVNDRLAGGHSLIRLIDSCSSHSRCLRELPEGGQATQILSDALIDPPQPLTPAFVIQTIAAAAARNKWCWGIAGVAAGIILGKLTANRPR